MHINYAHPASSCGAASAEAAPSWPRRLAALAAVLAAAAGLRGWLIAHTETIARDGTVYVIMARGWADHGMAGMRGYTYPPGYPVSIVAAHRVLTALGGDAGPAGWDMAGQLVSLASGVAATAGVWWFAGMILGWRIAWMAALLLAVGRHWAALGADVLSDAPAVCSYVWGAALAVATLDRLKRGSRWAIALAAGSGACAAAGYLFRPEAVLVGAVAGALWLAWRLGSRGPWRLTLASLGAMCAAAMACGGPYMIAIGGVTLKKSWGDFLWFPAVHAAPHAVNAGPAMIASAPPMPWAHVRGAAEVVSGLCAAMHPVLATLAVVWLAAWLIRRIGRPAMLEQAVPLPRAGGLFVMAGSLGLLAPLVVAHYARHGPDISVSYRYVMATAALASPLAAAGLLFLSRLAAAAFCRAGRLVAEGVFYISVFAAPITITRRRIAAVLLVVGHRAGLAAAGPWRRDVAERALAWAFTAIVAAALCVHSMRPLHEGKGQYARAGQVLGSMAAAGDFVFADNAWLLHYGHVEGRLIDPSSMTAEELVGLIRARPDAAGATYLVLSADNLDNDPPAIAALIAQAALAQLLTPLESPEPDRPATFRVYRVDRARLP